MSAAFDFKSPLRFEDEFDVAVNLATVTRRSIQYGFTITCRDTLIGTGTMTAVCTQKEGGQLHAVDLPDGLVDRLRRRLEEAAVSGQLESMVSERQRAPATARTTSARRISHHTRERNTFANSSY